MMILTVILARLVARDRIKEEDGIEGQGREEGKGRCLIINGCSRKNINKKILLV